MTRMPHTQNYLEYFDDHVPKFPPIQCNDENTTTLVSIIALITPLYTNYGVKCTHLMLLLILEICTCLVLRLIHGCMYRLYVQAVCTGCMYVI